jgi:hypothetical protein
MVLLWLILTLQYCSDGENAAFYPRLSILAKKYLAIPASYVQMYPQNEYLVLQVI